MLGRDEAVLDVAADELGVAFEGVPVAPAAGEFQNQALPGGDAPALAGRCLATDVCMYTNTPDEHFVIDLHPAHPQVSFASPCSGHGYKFASVIGEILADLATDGATRHPIGMFSSRRFHDARETA